jgi:hypothetical protein
MIFEIHAWGDLLAYLLFPLVLVPFLRHSRTIETLLNWEVFVIHATIVYLYFWTTGQSLLETQAMTTTAVGTLCFAFLATFVTSRMFHQQARFDYVFTALIHISTASGLIIVGILSLDQFKIFLALFATLVLAVFAMQVLYRGGTGPQAKMVRLAWVDSAYARAHASVVASVLATNLVLPTLLLLHLFEAQPHEPFTQGIFIDGSVYTTVNVFLTIMIFISVLLYIGLRKEHLEMLQFVRNHFDAIQSDSTVAGRTHLRDDFVNSSISLVKANLLHSHLLFQFRFEDGTLDAVRMLQHAGACKDPLAVREAFVTAIEGDTACMIVYAADHIYTFLAYMEALSGIMPYDAWRPNPLARSSLAAWTPAFASMLCFFMVINAAAAFIDAIAT